MIVLGGNDLLRGLDPGATRQNLDQIMARLAELNIKTFLCGMLAPLNLGPEYSREFNPIYPELAQNMNSLFIHFFFRMLPLCLALINRTGCIQMPMGWRK